MSYVILCTKCKLFSLLAATSAEFLYYFSFTFRSYPFLFIKDLDHPCSRNVYFMGLPPLLVVAAMRLHLQCFRIGQPLYFSVSGISDILGSNNEI